MANDVSDAEPATIVGEPAMPDDGLGGLDRGANGRRLFPVRPAPLARRRRDPHATRPPAIGLAALLLGALLAAFFGWVSAEPFWLSMGLGTEGTATVSSCRDSGPARPCVGHFTASGAGWTGEAPPNGVPSDTARSRAARSGAARSGAAANVVRLSGVPDAERRPGASLDAKMLDPDSRWAYAGPTNLRWQLGLAAVVACGLLLGWATGVGRLRAAGRRGRLQLRLLSLGAPLVVFAGVILAALA